MSSDLGSGCKSLSLSLTCPGSLPGWIFNQSLNGVVMLTLLSLKIPNRSMGEDESHQKNARQSQETGHLVSLEQETFIWSFCAFMPFCAPLASDLSTPALHPWLGAPCLYAEMLGLTGGGISTPKLQIFWVLISIAGCSSCSFDWGRSLFWRIVWRVLTRALQLWFHTGWYRHLRDGFRCKSDKTHINDRDRNSSFKTQLFP